MAMTGLSGRTAIVTGGSRGIGRAIVARMLDEGALVLACGRGARPGDLPAGAGWMQADVANPAAAAALFARARESFGPVTILVNNAGIQIEKTVAETTDADWDALVGINCRGVFNMCRAFLAQPGATGSIANIGSISGEAADPRLAIYNASKAFVHGLTRSIAVDHGPDVRCNAVRPGWIQTGMLEAGFALARDPAAARADALARHAARRFGTPEDIANAVAWLVSDQSGFVTGQCFTVDGGLTAASPLQPGLY